MPTEKQIDITRATFRMLKISPGHVTYGIWINGGKSGELVVSVSEVHALETMLLRGGFAATHVPGTT